MPAFAKQKAAHETHTAQKRAFHAAPQPGGESGNVLWQRAAERCLSELSEVHLKHSRDVPHATRHQPGRGTRTCAGKVVGMSAHARHTTIAILTAHSCAAMLISSLCYCLQSEKHGRDVEYSVQAALSTQASHATCVCHSTLQGTRRGTR